MFESIFRTMLTMSAGASIVILMVIGLRLILRKAPKRFSYVLWVLVIIRLLCPVFPESGFSLMPADVDVATVLETVTAPEEQSLMDERPTFSVDVPVVSQQRPVQQPQSAEISKPAQQGTVSEEVQSPTMSVQEQLPLPLTQPQTEKLQLTGWQIGSIVWLIGIWIMALYGVWSLFRLKSRLVASIDVGNGVYLADNIDTPFVMGLFRPKIYLPSYLKLEKAEYIVLHEKHHIGRLDYVVKLLYFAALCLHWFNLLVWVAFILMGYDMEMSCDEAVMEKLTQDVRSDYAESLLQLSTGRRKIAPTPLAFGEGDPKGRIKNIMNYRKPHFWIVLVAVIVCVAAAVCLLTNPAETDTEFLNYPGLQWGMTPEEVKSALELTAEDIVMDGGETPEDEFSWSDPPHYVITVKGMTCFGEETSLARFLFYDYSLTCENFGLETVELYYPDQYSDDPANMKKVRNTLSRYYGEPVDQLQNYDFGMPGTDPAIKTYDVPEGYAQWNSEDNLDTYLTQEQKDALYELYEAVNKDKETFIADRELYELRYQVNWLATAFCDEHNGPADGYSDDMAKEGYSNNFVRISVHGKHEIDAYLQYKKDGVLPAGKETTEPTQPTQPIEPDAMLNFPGLRWRMTPAEVKSALRLRDKQIKTEKLVETVGNSPYYYMSVPDIEVFGEKVSLAAFYFSDGSRMGGPYELYEIQLFYPDEQSAEPADFEKIVENLTECYGQPAQERVRKDMDMNPSTVPVPEGQYLWVSAQDADAYMTEEQKDLLYQYTIRNLVDKSTGDREFFDKRWKQNPVSSIQAYSDYLRENADAERENGLTDYCVYLSTIKTWIDRQIKNCNNPESLLVYPYMIWGDNPDYLRIDLEHMGWTVDSDELETKDGLKRTMELNGQDYFGHKVKKLVLEFTGDTESSLQLSFVRFVMDPSVSAADIEQELKMRYGSEPETYWDCSMVDGKYTEQLTKPLMVMSAWPSFATPQTRYTDYELDALRTLYESENGVMVSDEDWAKFAENRYLVSLMFGINGQATPDHETEDPNCVVIDYDARELIAYDKKVAKIRQSYDAMHLNYPGLDWGMTIEEVKTALGFGDDAIVNVEDRSDVMGYYVEGLNYFDLPTEQILLNFTSYHGNPWGLYEVVVLLPDDTDMERAKQTVTAYYGEPIDSYSYPDLLSGKTITEKSEEGNDLWLSEATSGNTFSEAELEFCCQYWKEQYAGGFEITKENVMENLRTTPLTRLNLTDDLHGKVFHVDHPDLEKIKAVRYNSSVYDMEQFFDHYREQVEHIGMLNYPSLDWGMTPEEVQTALGYSDDAVEITDAEQVRHYTVKGLEYLGLPTEYVELTFTSTMGSQLGLYAVGVVLPDDTDMEKAKEIVTSIYGEPIDTYDIINEFNGKPHTEKSEEGNDLWLSQATVGNTFSEAEQEFYWKFWEEQYKGSFELTRENFMASLRTTPLVRINLTDDLHRKVNGFPADSDIETIKVVFYYSNFYQMERFFAYHADKIG